VKSSFSPGPGVDANGVPVTDPTKNVIALTKAGLKAQSDLFRAEMHRQDDLRKSERRHAREMGKLRSRHSAKLRKAEASRINDIRRVDVEASQRAQTVADQRADTLAKQVADTANTLRLQVETTEKALTDSIAVQIAPLREALYQGQGAKEQSTEQRTVIQTDRTNIYSLVLAIVSIATLVFYIVTHH
jgi:hypothetical protein